jgi:hypothetical protein
MLTLTAPMRNGRAGEIMARIIELSAPEQAAPATV